MDRGRHATSDHHDEADAELCRRWCDHHDIAAASALATRHRRLVVKLAERHRAAGPSWEDLLAEGHVGLMRAICRFDPDRGVTFAAYAAWWVAGSLQFYARKSGHRARTTAGAAQRSFDRVDHPVHHRSAAL